MSVPTAPGGHHIPFHDRALEITDCYFLLYFQVTSFPNSREAAYTVPLVGEMSKNLQVFLKPTEEEKISEKRRGGSVIEVVLLTGGEVGEKVRGKKEVRDETVS